MKTKSNLFSLLLSLVILNLLRAGVVSIDFDYTATAGVEADVADVYDDDEQITPNGAANAYCRIDILQDLPDIWWDTSVTCQADIEATIISNDAQIASSLSVAGGDDFLWGYGQASTLFSGTFTIGTSSSFPADSPLTLSTSIHDYGTDAFSGSRSGLVKIWADDPGNPLVLTQWSTDGIGAFDNLDSFSADVLAGQILNIQISHSDYEGVGHSFSTDMNLLTTLTVVPEPATVILFGLGTLILTRKRRFHRKRKR